MIRFDLKIAATDVLVALNKIGNTKMQGFFDNLKRMDESAPGIKNPTVKSVTGHISVKKELLNTYAEAWNGDRVGDIVIFREAKVNSVYRVLKKLAFGHNFYGKLTGSTLNSIDIQSKGDRLQAGILKGKAWPSEQGNKKVSMKAFATEMIATGIYDRDSIMKNFLTGNIGQSMYAATQLGRRKALRSWTGEEPINIDYGGNGFDIKWPVAARKLLNYEDVHIPKQWFAGKKYGEQYIEGSSRKPTVENRQEKFFYLTDAFMGDVMSSVGDYFESRWARSGYKVSYGEDDIVTRIGKLMVDYMSPNISHTSAQRLEEESESSKKAPVSLFNEKMAGGQKQLGLKTKSALIKSLEQLAVRKINEAFKDDVYGPGMRDYMTGFQVSKWITSLEKLEYDALREKTPYFTKSLASGMLNVLSQKISTITQLKREEAEFKAKYGL